MGHLRRTLRLQLSLGFSFHYLAAVLSRSRAPFLRPTNVRYHWNGLLTLATLLFFPAAFPTNGLPPAPSHALYANVHRRGPLIPQSIMRGDRRESRRAVALLPCFSLRWPGHVHIKSLVRDANFFIADPRLPEVDGRPEFHRQSRRLDNSALIRLNCSTHRHFFLGFCNHQLVTVTGSRLGSS